MDNNKTWMEPTKKLEAEMLNDYEAENLQLHDTVNRQAAELERMSRELEIEAALEKIRSRSMAMHHSGELKEVVTVTFQRLSELNVLQGTVGIQLFDHDSKNAVAWVGTTIQDP